MGNSFPQHSQQDLLRWAFFPYAFLWVSLVILTRQFLGWAPGVTGEADGLLSELLPECSPKRPLIRCDRSACPRLGHICRLISRVSAPLASARPQLLVASVSVSLKTGAAGCPRVCRLSAVRWEAGSHLALLIGSLCGTTGTSSGRVTR